MLASIVNTFGNCFKIPELKSRIGFTFLLLAICRLAAFIRVPGLDGAALHDYLNSSAATGGGVMNMYSLFTGGALENCAVGALGIMPYISATIVMQLLTAVVPSLSKAAREDGGQVKIIKYSRYLTVLLCIGQGFFMAISWEHPATIFSGFPRALVMYPENWIWWYRFQTVLILTIGTLLLMWLGEQITERGIGNGISLIITIGILARLPQAGQSGVVGYVFPGRLELNAEFNLGHAIALDAAAGGGGRGRDRGDPGATEDSRAIRAAHGGPQSIFRRHIVPAFAAELRRRHAHHLRAGHPDGPAKTFHDDRQQLSVIQILDQDFQHALNEGAFVYLTIYTLMILFFSYFWTATQFNELQIADDLKKNGGYVPGVRPGQATSNFLHNAMSRITLAGAVFLTVIAVIPIILTRSMGIPYQVSTFFGGTSMLILVGVMLDTMRQMESHLLMRHYDGFLKGGGSGGASGGRL